MEGPLAPTWLEMSGKDWQLGQCLTQYFWKRNTLNTSYMQVIAKNRAVVSDITEGRAPSILYLQDKFDLWEII